ncbi:hypothetical protein [Sphaerisporangium fuscum]|uniref:hypothetical protein n=1 Tax=Sphaerisporangium fuscum TaxID=2835868 RepID=UPI001BDCDA7E|nr:hypothetical protein [Sphaerisporangium fuscum]
MTLTTTRPVSPPPSAPPAAAPPAAASRLRWVLAAGWIAHVLLRLWLARWRTGPVANPDEVGYLVAARWLAGGPGADLSGSTFYQGGYPLVLTPIFWFVHDPALAYRLVVAVNALIGAALFPLGFLALRRLAPQGLVPGRWAACALAFAAALLPATMVFGQMALTDAVLPTLVLGWLLALHAFARSGSARAGALAGALAGYGFAVHMRGSVLLFVHVLIVAFVLVRRWVPRRAALAAVAVTAVTAAGAQVLNGAVRAAIYPGGPRDLSALLGTRLTGLDGQAWAICGAAGQVWYLVVGTWGLAGVGIAVATAAALRRRTPPATRVTLLALLLLTAAVAYASSAALPDEHRVGNYAYGRYLTCVAVVLALLGLAALARAGRREALRYAAASAGLLVVTGAVAAVYAGDRIRTYNFIAFDFPEVSFLTRSHDALRMAPASAAALALLAVLTAASLVGLRRPSPPGTAVSRPSAAFPAGRRGPLPALALVAVNLAFVAGGTFDGPARPPVPDPLVRRGGVVVDRQVSWWAWLPLSYRVEWTRLRLNFDTAHQAPPAGTCTVIVPEPEAGGAPETSWPGHPAGWRPAAASGWVGWTSPACLR